MMKVLEWLYRAKPELPENFSDNKPTSDLLEILRIADFLQLTGFGADYAFFVEMKLKSVLVGNDRFKNIVEIMNEIYRCGGRINPDELKQLVDKVKRYDRQAICEMGRYCFEMTDPIARFLQDIYYATTMALI